MDIPKTVTPAGKVIDDPLYLLIDAINKSNSLKAKELELKRQEIEKEKDKEKPFYSVEEIKLLLRKDRESIKQMILNNVIIARIDSANELKKGKTVILKKDFEEFLNKIQSPEYPYNFPEATRNWILSTKLYLNYNS